MNNRAIGISLVLVAFILISGCGNKGNTGGSGGFYLTNVLSNGELLQIFKSTSGLAIVPSESDVVISFGSNGMMTVFFDRATLKPSSTMLEVSGNAGVPRQTVADLNADGVPEIRQIKGSEVKQIYFKGRWYDSQESGTNYFITIEGAVMSCFFDGQAWIKTDSNHE